ncbi:MAG: efflux RND transporter periplasmic adaptor subunit [Fimbriiglobus sp.]|jgi:biotin carboxyl carrier protein|nr:efflux RND transporter periplasmic adaptor subunit [Fimbriiglobus sp.]
MNLRPLIRPVVSAVVLAALATSGYFTRDLWIPFLFPDPTAKTTETNLAEHDDSEEHDEVHLSAQAVKNLNLVIEKISPRAYWRTLLVPGMVVDRPGESDRNVTARLGGVVTKISARPGDYVSAGKPLFTLQLVGETLPAIQRDLATAAKELAIATADRDRVARLVADRVSPPANLVDPENKVKRAAAQVGGLRRQLLALGLSAEQIEKAEGGEFLTELAVNVPVAHDHLPTDSLADKLTPSVFEVQDLKVKLGDTVQAGQVLCVLACHERLFVEGQAFKSEATILARLAEEKVGVQADFTDEKKGEWPEQPPLLVHHLANVIDPASRTFPFYMALDNQPRLYERDGKKHYLWRYQPGQRVRLRVPVEKLGDSVIVLPTAAVVREGADAFLFTGHGDHFHRLPVRVLHEDRTEVVIADGAIPKGAKVVMNQAAALNRALKAATTEGGHEHEHEH